MSWGVAAILGGLVPLALPATLPMPLLGPLAAAACLLLFAPRTRRLGVMGLATVVVSLAMVSSLERRHGVFPQDAQMALSGRVVQLPAHRDGMSEFLFEPDPSNQVLASGRWRLRWYEPPVRVRSGERWRFEWRARPARGRINFAGPDPERQFLSRGIDALGTVRSGQRLNTAPGGLTLHALRERVADRLRRLLADRPGADLVLALAVADRVAIENDTRDALRNTGTGHLLAISGLHVGLVAWMAFVLTRGLCALWPGVPGRLNAQLLCAWASLGPAIAYAALAGWGTSTRRALVMLCLWVLSRSLARRVPGGAIICAATVTIIALDPLAPLASGFWLSFGAVVALLCVFRPRRPLPGRWRSLWLAQVAIGVVLTPVVMHEFQFVTPGGSLVNLLAIPIVSAITLPLVLAGLLSLPLPDAWPEAWLAMAAASADAVGAGLRLASDHLADLTYRTAPLTVALAALAVTGGLALCGPRGLSWRWLGLGLYLPAFALSGPRPESSTHTVEVLDVGQGLAALVRTRQHLLLYDAGPGLPGTWDLFTPVLAPALARHGRQWPDWLLLSHGDLDHAGGGDAFAAALPAHRMINRRDAPGPGCFDAMAWTWDGVRFDVLHPSPWLPYLGNDSSCVLAVRGMGGSSLLPGDIGHRAEQRLVGHPGNFDLLIAPHHGSRHSSSSEFLAWSDPRWVVVPNGHGNRFGFPHDAVSERVNRQGAVLITTAECGGLEFRFSSEGPAQRRSARRARKTPWRWPAATNCP